MAHDPMREALDSIHRQIAGVDSTLRLQWWLLLLLALCYGAWLYFLVTWPLTLPASSVTITTPTHGAATY